MDYVDISILEGLVLNEIGIDDSINQIKFVDDKNNVYIMHHKQDCGENMFIEGIYGNPEDILGSPIIRAEEIINYNEIPLYEDCLDYTWKLYEIATNKSCISIRWYGELNGYYI